MLRQYYASPWMGGDNPLRVGPIATGTIFRLPGGGGVSRTSPWIVEGFRNGVCAATRRHPNTGAYEDRFIRGRSDAAVLRSLADGTRRDVMVHLLLRLEHDGLGEGQYPSLPDVARFHGSWRHRQAVV